MKTIKQRGIALAVLLAGTQAAGAIELPMLDCVIEPYEVIEVSSAAEGVLERVHVERNDLVTRGQIVAELESDVEKASLAYAQFNASLSSEIKLRRASLDFDKRNHERVEELYTKQAIPLHHKDEAETDAAKSRWLLTKAEDDKRLAALEYARASAVLKRKTVRSPISGVVVARHKSTGEYIEDQAIITVAQLHPLRVEVIAPVELFGAITRGMRAEITPELAITGSLSATVMSVDRVIDGESGTFDVRLELPNPDYAIPSGLKCEITFTDAPAPGEFELPQPAPAAPAPTELEPTTPNPAEEADLREASNGAADARPDIASVDTAPEEDGSMEASATGVTSAQVAAPLTTDAALSAGRESAAASSSPVLPQLPPKNDETAVDDEPTEPDLAASAGVTMPEDAGVKPGASCRIIGPFKSDADAERLTARIGFENVSATPVQRTEEVVHSYILATPPAPDKAAKAAIAAQIAEHGIRDTALLYKGSLKDRYSFGVYNNEVVASVKQRSLQKLGFEIELLPRKREVARWWLEVVSGDAHEVLSALDRGENGTFVTAPCAPNGTNVGASAASIAVAPVN